MRWGPTATTARGYPQRPMGSAPCSTTRTSTPPSSARSMPIDRAPNWGSRKPSRPTKGPPASTKGSSDGRSPCARAPTCDSTGTVPTSRLGARSRLHGRGGGVAADPRAGAATSLGSVRQPRQTSLPALLYPGTVGPLPGPRRSARTRCRVGDRAAPLRRRPAHALPTGQRGRRTRPAGSGGATTPASASSTNNSAGCCRPSPRPTWPAAPISSTPPTTARCWASSACGGSATCWRMPRASRASLRVRISPQARA